jgi:hypothetical protein
MKEQYECPCHAVHNLFEWDNATLLYFDTFCTTYTEALKEGGVEVYVFVCPTCKKEISGELIKRVENKT